MIRLNIFKNLPVGVYSLREQLFDFYGGKGGCQNKKAQSIPLAHTYVSLKFLTQYMYFNEEWRSQTKYISPSLLSEMIK